MRRITASRPSPAILVAVVALVAAVAGTAVADPVASTSKLNKKKAKQIATKQIKKLAPDLSVANADTADTANSANTVADGAVTTPKIANGALTAPKLGTLTRRVASVEIADGDVDSVTAECLNGETAISGGATKSAVLGPPDPGWSLRTVSMNPAATAWTASAENDTGSAKTLFATVLCLRSG